jgi:hypothetical protein
MTYHIHAHARTTTRIPLHSFGLHTHTKNHDLRISIGSYTLPWIYIQQQQQSFNGFPAFIVYIIGVGRLFFSFINISGARSGRDEGFFYIFRFSFFIILDGMVLVGEFFLCDYKHFFLIGLLFFGWIGFTTFTTHLF